MPFYSLRDIELAMEAVAECEIAIASGLPFQNQYNDAMDAWKKAYWLGGLDYVQARLKHAPTRQNPCTTPKYNDAVSHTYDQYADALDMEEPDY